MSEEIPRSLDVRDRLPKISHKTVYLAGKYRDDRGQSFVWDWIAEARKAAIALWTLGIPAVSPHHNTLFFDGIVDSPTILAGDGELVKHQDALVVLPNWKLGSTGTEFEIDTAFDHGKPVFLWDEDIIKLLHFCFPEGLPKHFLEQSKRALPKDVWGRVAAWVNGDNSELNTLPRLWERVGAVAGHTAALARIEIH